MKHSAALLYLPILLVVAVVSGLIANFAYFAGNVAECRFSNEPDAYMGYCAHPLFGDYEHGVFEWNLHPQAAAALKAADVLVLGSSVIQVALSTDAASSYFKRIGAHQYLLGFGYGEQDAFAAQLLHRFKPRPKLVIINTDPFFAGGLSAPAQAVTEGSLSTRLSYWRKSLFEALQATICSWTDRCNDKTAATYRRNATGEWIWKTVWYPASSRLPVTASKKSSVSPSDLQLWAENADRFITENGLDRSCIILTGTPNSMIDSAAIAQSIGKELNITAITPQLDDMATADYAHLSWESAEQWSQRFLQDSSPIIQRCLSKKES